MTRTPAGHLPAPPFHRSPDPARTRASNAAGAGRTAAAGICGSPVGAPHDTALRDTALRDTAPHDTALRARAPRAGGAGRAPGGAVRPGARGPVAAGGRRGPR